MTSLNNEFLEELASAAPTPGGGAACACVGALASSLASMVANLTLHKKGYEAHEQEMAEAIEALANCRELLLSLMAEDEKAFGALAACWRMPKTTKKEIAARHEAEQRALVTASEVPLQIMRICAKIIEIDEFMVRDGNRNAIADAGAAAVFAKAAIQAAALNVYGNTTYMDDLDAADEYDEQAHDLVMTFGARADEIYLTVSNGAVNL